jgi:hypothetical protein
MLGLFATAARAHDPYEITTRAFLYSNHLELRIEMEFPAAMLLAGQAGWRSNGLAAGEQLSLAYPTLSTRAAAFLHVLTNGVSLPVTSTNVALGVEDHVSFILRLPPPSLRGLSFAIGELKQLSAHGQYGTSLTILDMVQQQVLGQAVLFGDSAPYAVDVTEASSPALRVALPEVIRLSASSLNTTRNPGVARSAGGRWWLLFLVAAGVVLVVAGWIRPKH